MKLRCKIYRMNDNQWKERGTGNCKLMRDRAEKKIRFVMRQEKTLKPCANHLGKSKIFHFFYAIIKAFLGFLKHFQLKNCHFITFFDKINKISFNMSSFGGSNVRVDPDGHQ